MIDAIVVDEQEETPQRQPSNGHALAPSGSDGAAERGMQDASAGFIQSREVVSNETTTSIRAKLDAITKDPKSLYWKSLGLTAQEYEARKGILAEVQGLHAQLAAQQDPLRQAENENIDVVEAGFRNAAEESGAPVELVDSFVKAASGDVPSELEAVTILEKTHGADLDLVLAQADVAYKAALEVNPQIKDLLESTGLGNHPGVIAHAAKIGAEIIAAKQELTKLRADEKYTRASHPLHAEAVREVARLTRLAQPFSR